MLSSESWTTTYIMQDEPDLDFTANLRSSTLSGYIEDLDLNLVQVKKARVYFSSVIIVIKPCFTVVYFGFYKKCFYLLLS